MIDICNISFSYGEKPILRDYSLRVGRGERICLFATSGIGKTTLLRLIAGLEKPTSGEIRLGGRVTYLFQEDRLLPWLNLLDNLTLIGADRQRALRVLESVGLEDAEKFPDELSGGMRRRAAIARAICAGGEILLLDEPFTGLDAGLRGRSAEALKREFADAAVIMVTHIQEEAEIMGAEIVNFVPDARANI